MGSDRPDDPAPATGTMWLALRVVPLALLATVFAARLPGLDLRGSDRISVPLVGLGLPLVAIVLWLLRRQAPDQETLAGTARVATILAVMTVAGLMTVIRSH